MLAGSLALAPGAHGRPSSPNCVSSGSTVVSTAPRPWSKSPTSHFPRGSTSQYEMPWNPQIRRARRASAWRTARFIAAYSNRVTSSR